MPEVKWVKISTNVFNDDRILLLTMEPNADELLLEWLKLLFASGETNKNGKVNGDKLALFQESHVAVFEKYRMVNWDDQSNIVINDWKNLLKIDRECIVNDGNYDDLRRLVLERDNYICVYCGQTSEYLEADHVLPKSRGGMDTLENLVCSCRACNRSKKDKTPEEWRVKIGRQQEILLHETER